MIVKDKHFNAALFAGNLNDGIRDLDAADVPTLKELSKIEDHYVNVLNIHDVTCSRRFNPIQHKYIPTLQDALILSERITSTFWNEEDCMPRYFQLYKEISSDILAACIWFFVNYKKMPYDKDRRQLYPEYCKDIETGNMKPTGRVFDSEANMIPTTPDYWLGKYSDLPHILSFLCHDYSEIIDILKTVPEIYPLITPLISSWQDKTMDLVELFTIPLRTMLNKLCTPEAYWVFHRDGDDFDLRRNENLLIINCREGYEKAMNMMSILVTGKVPEQRIMEISNKYPWRDTIIGNLTAKIYDFRPYETKEKVLLENMENVNRDVNNLICEIQQVYKFLYK